MSHHNVASISRSATPLNVFVPPPSILSLLSTGDGVTLRRWRRWRDHAGDGNGVVAVIRWVCIVEQLCR